MAVTNPHAIQKLWKATRDFQLGGITWLDDASPLESQSTRMEKNEKLWRRKRAKNGFGKVAKTWSGQGHKIRSRWPTSVPFQATTTTQEKKTLFFTFFWHIQNVNNMLSDQTTIPIHFFSYWVTQLHLRDYSYITFAWVVNVCHHFDLL